MYKDEFGNYIIEDFEDLGFNLEFDRLNELTDKLNIIGKEYEQLKQNQDEAIEYINDVLNNFDEEDKSCDYCCGREAIASKVKSILEKKEG